VVGSAWYQLTSFDAFVAKTCSQWVCRVDMARVYLIATGLSRSGLKTSLADP
jgi:hypothetical protein